MSIVSYTSAKEIMARIIRNNGGKMPAHYMDSFLEWIPEAIEQLETKYQMETRSTGNWCDGNPEPGALVTKNHVAPLPCGITDLIAVENEFGERVREGSDITDLTNQTTRYQSGGDGAGLSGARVTNFQVDVFDHKGANPAIPPPGQTVPYDGSGIKEVQGGNTANYYKIQGNMIQTSAECMFIKLHYQAMPIDGDGYPMVPNVEEYKQAVFFYCQRQLVAAGFDHKIWNGPQGYNYLDNQWEKYAGRALGVIKYPDQDRMERLRTSFAERLIPPHHFYNDFFIGGEQTQEIQNI